MTRAEIREYVRNIVDAAPPLTPDAADRLRALLPRDTRITAYAAPVQQRPAPVKAA